MKAPGEINAVPAPCVIVLFTAVILLPIHGLGAEESGCGLCELASRVEPLLLEETVRELSGADSVLISGERVLIETRYTFSDMKLKALEYCRRKAESYGYTPELQSFPMPPLMDDLYALERFGDTLWAGARDGRIYIMTAGAGNTGFRKISHIPGMSILGLDKAPDGRLFAVCDTRIGPGGAVYRSGDGGFSWELCYRAEHGLQTVSFMDRLRGIAAGFYGTVVVTADGGESWTVIDPLLFGFRTLTGSDAAGGLFRLSSNNGTVYTGEGAEAASWRDTSICGCDLRDISFAGRENGIAVGDSSVFHTPDGGATWSVINPGEGLFSAAVADSAVMAAGGGDGNIYITRDGWQSWERIQTGSGDRREALAFAGTDSLFSAGEEFVILTDTGGGIPAENHTWAAADTVTGINLIFSATGTRTPGKRVILCAHYDSQNTTIGESPYISAPGADDNGTGVAAVLECARIMKDCVTGYSVDFILFDGEEEGLYGSRHFSSAARSPADYLAVINLDLIGADYSGESVIQVAARETQADSSLYLQLVETAEILGERNALQYLTPSPVSDHRPFWEEVPDIGSVLIIEGGYSSNPHYHSSADIADNIDYDYLASVVRIALASAAARVGYLGAVPDETVFLGSFPNPFSTGTAIRFELPRRMEVRLGIYDVTGRMLTELIEGSAGPGSIQYTWDGRNGRGGRVASGVYFIRLRAGNRSFSEKLVIVR
jgi:hypothetical protein